MNPQLSIIIPAYNEEGRIGVTLKAVGTHLKDKHRSYEIIVVDDGSVDGTAALLKRYVATVEGLSVVRLQKHKGKGAAVREGMLAAKGESRLFMDADNSTAIDQIEKLTPYIGQGYDIVIGSRRIAGAQILLEQSPLREFLGAQFRLIAHFLVPLDVIDTQNGFKLFTAQAAEIIFNRITINGWSFDVEVLALAKRLGYKIKEVPIIWANDDQSRVQYIHMLTILRGLLYIRKKYLRPQTHSEPPCLADGANRREELSQ
jgi:dolichyl-phosphate beta-glucosyltransferase